MLNWRKYLFYLLPPLLAVIVIFAVNFKTDLSAFIIAGDSAEEILLATEMQSGALSRRYLISISSRQKNAVSSAFIKQLKAQLDTIEGVMDVWLAGQQTDIIDVIQSLYSGQHISALYSLNPEPRLKQVFSRNGLSQRAETLKTALLSPQAAIIKKIAIQDPLLLTLDSFRALGSQMQPLSSVNRLYRNMVLETSMTGLDATQQSRIHAAINSAFNKVNLSWQDQFQFEITGVPVFATATQKLIRGDITRISILSSIVLVVLFLLIFRSYSALFQVFTVMAIVILTAILTTQLVFSYVHGMTVALGATLVGICIDYPIHALAHAQAKDTEDKINIIARIWPSMLLGGITTMIGYIALGVSGYPGFQQVAVFAASGIVMGLLLTRYILPRLISGKSQRSIRIPWVAGWAGFCQRFRRWIIVLLLIPVVVSISALKSLNWMQDMQELTPELNVLKQKDRQIRSRMTSIEPGRFILISAEDLEQTLQKVEQVYPLLDQLKKAKFLKDYVGLYPWLLSAQRQIQNQSALKAYLTAENLLLWQQALKQQGLSVKKLGHLDYATTALLTLEQLLATPIKRFVQNHVISGKNQTILMIWLADHQPDAVRSAMQQIDGAQYFSQREILNKMTHDYTERAKTLLLIGLGLIIIVLSCRYKSLLKTIETLLPAVLAALLILLGWSVTGASISFLHLVGFLLVVAICVDYGIFYRENRGGDINLTYQAMAASMLTSAVAFASLIAADSTALKILSAVVALGVVLGFLLCPLIITTGKSITASDIED